MAALMDSGVCTDSRMIQPMSQIFNHWVELDGLLRGNYSTRDGRQNEPISQT